MAYDSNQENNDASWNECLRQISELPPKWQHTYAWLINNFEFAVKICESTNLTPSELNQLEHHAIENNDTTLELLIKLKRILDP